MVIVIGFVAFIVAILAWSLWTLSRRSGNRSNDIAGDNARNQELLAAEESMKALGRITMQNPGAGNGYVP